MKIRSVARPGETGEAGNTFVAVDDFENKLGSCRVETFHRGELLPERPCEIRITVGGEGSAQAQLLGTAFARAVVLARESGVSARVYAECSPRDGGRMELYKSVGLIDDDALVRMSRCVVQGPNVVRLPEGCTFVADDLTDPQERAFFIDRQKQLFGRTDAEAWLEEICDQPMMRRLLLVSREGLVGEVVCWAEQGDGYIGMVYTAPAWRRRGVASYLIEAARQYFYQCRLPESHIDVRMHQQAMMSAAATAGYRRSEVLMRLPGVNLDVPKKRKR